MSWKLEITCPKGHKNNIGLYYNEYEFVTWCITCDPKNNKKPMHTWTIGDQEANGVTLS